MGLKDFTDLMSHPDGKRLSDPFVDQLNRQLAYECAADKWLEEAGPQICAALAAHGNEPAAWKMSGDGVRRDLHITRGEHTFVVRHVVDHRSKATDQRRFNVMLHNQYDLGGFLAATPEEAAKGVRLLEAIAP